ncbi:hypothetical protein FLAG1_10058 [Fusarium langsethiae]|uniref:Uncharacterized protein n=1 Tax=Fusarium langsethiae TaxID=179993 RepID=A0A0M9EPC3_FUSLA|nr:hypothetical protein FLAG1_10058 [Fusarium langsethiae]GKU07167.1 unnamed protein product [Fusarium langsethiae]
MLVANAYITHSSDHPSGPMNTSTYSSDALEHASRLAGWLVGLGDDDWVSYLGTNVEQCKSPDRKKNIVDLIKAGRIETIGRVAFVFRCRGPFVGALEPTPRETFPGEIMLISQPKPHNLFVNGALMRQGYKQEIDGPPRIEVDADGVIFFLVTFTKRV